MVYHDICDEPDSVTSGGTETLEQPERYARLRMLVGATHAEGEVVFLTGAGISAESGIPTFRGPEGYWTIGSKVYEPSVIGTQAMFRRDARQVWRWYLFRRHACHRASPNAAHRAIVRAETAFPHSVHVVTQNIDGLHVRAGSRPEHCYEVHGSGDRMRCTAECGRGRMPIPDDLVLPTRDTPLEEEDFLRLVCDACGAPTRPHVLWFDECYDEGLYRSETALRTVASASLLIVVGSSGATSLPMQALRVAVYNHAVLINIDPNPNPFGSVAGRYERGLWLPEAASCGVERVVEEWLDAR